MPTREKVSSVCDATANAIDDIFEFTAVGTFSDTSQLLQERNPALAEHLAHCELCTATINAYLECKEVYASVLD